MGNYDDNHIDLFGSIRHLMHLLESNGWKIKNDSQYVLKSAKGRYIMTWYLSGTGVGFSLSLEGRRDVVETSDGRKGGLLHRICPVGTTIEEQRTIAQDVFDDVAGIEDVREAMRSKKLKRLWNQL